MKWLSALTVSMIALLSCEKDQDTEEVIKTFVGPLPIVQTNTPPTALAGQDIRSNVRCQLYSLGGSVYFQGFDIRETSPREYAISANALYKDWNTQIHASVMLTMDTVVTISTKTAGRHILRFYNGSRFFKADTVQVN